MSTAKMYDFSVLRELRKRAGLNLSQVAEKSGVSIAVISKLERNQTIANLETLYKLGLVFGMNPSDFLNLAENRSAQRTTSRIHKSGSFQFKEITYGNVRCLIGNGSAGSKVSRPKIHQDDYEVCWVIKGYMKFYLPNETLELRAGDAIQFDALLEHTYEAIEDSKVIIIHLRKDKKF